MDLQNDLTKSTKWSKVAIAFQPRECEVLELGRVKQSLPTSYLLTGQKFKVVEKHKHLGLVN